MKNLWIELDYYQNSKMKCIEDVVMILKFWRRTGIWVLGRLENWIWSSACTYIWIRSLPTRSEFFSIVWSEGWRRGIMLETLLSDNFALIAVVPTTFTTFSAVHNIILIDQTALGLTTDQQTTRMDYFAIF